MIRARFFVALAAATMVAAGAVLVTPPAPAQDEDQPGFHFDGSMYGDHAVPSVWPDPRVRWDSYAVGGLKLTGRDMTITLPKGAELWVPTAVKDSLFDAN